MKIRDDIKLPLPEGCTYAKCIFSGGTAPHITLERGRVYVVKRLTSVNTQELVRVYNDDNTTVGIFRASRFKEL